VTTLAPPRTLGPDGGGGLSDGRPATAPPPVDAVGRARRGLKDGLVMTERTLLTFVRTPEALFFMSLQPIMFVLLFRYVFGGAIKIPNYQNYLMPGIFVQTAAFGSVGTAVGIAEDLQKGLIERFRALPMPRSAVLFGRALADICRGVLVIAIMTAVGFAVGFRPNTGVLGYLAAVGIILFFLHAVSWGFCVIGLAAPNSETAQVMAFPLLFPLTFASSAFVLTSQMPGWLQPFANNQPLSKVIDAVRHLMLGGPTTGDVVAALAWTAGLLAVLAPLAVYRYRRIT
jgi:ABC-2 type transport system permease protein